jgi:hypothetical protein
MKSWELETPCWFSFLVAGLGLPLLMAATLLPGCSRKDDSRRPDPELESALERRPTIPPPRLRFVDITAKAGIHFVHVNGAFGKKLLPETMGSGCAFLDFDKDGKQDLLLVNSCYWPGHEAKSGPTPTLALYRNRGDGTFEDVTAAAGLKITLYGMAVTVGDYDNDGWPDLYITAVGGGRLFHNASDGKGGRRFIDVTAEAKDLARSMSRTATPFEDSGRATDFLEREEPISFPSSAAFVDYDNDGKLDLFVCHYVTWSPKTDLVQGFTLKGHGRAYGPPTSFTGSHCVLYRNLGDGKFEDVSAKAGIQVTGERGEAIGKSLGVAVCDVDGDGWPDIVVANDTVRNFFFHNQKDGTFKERGKETGVAYAEGSARGAMGIDWAEYRPGRFALVIGNFADEPNTLLRLDNPSSLLFSDVALIEGLAGPSRIVLKFGLFFFDYDLDGLLDLLTCNGHLEPDISLVQTGQSYKQPAQLYWNTGQRRAFEMVTPEYAGPDLFQPMVGRGCAYADIDGNGTLDVVLTENGGPARLFRNEGGTGNHWIRIALEGDGKRCNTSAIGAQVTLFAGGKVQKRLVTSARGYLSQSEFPVTFGLGKTDKVDRIEIRWPGPQGTTQVIESPPVDRLHSIRQAAGPEKR